MTELRFAGKDLKRLEAEAERRNLSVDDTLAELVREQLSTLPGMLTEHERRDIDRFVEGGS